MFRTLSLGVVFMASALAQAHPPQILEVAREYLRPGAVQAVHKIEVDAAQICIRLKFPRRYLVLESLTGPKEFWYLNAFDSQAELDEVGRQYEGNKALTSALAENLKRKAPYLAAESTNVFLNYRPELTVGTPWVMGHGRFVVTAWTKEPARTSGTVFEGPDGNRLVIRAVRTRAEAESILAAAGAGTHVFAIHPELGWPDEEWVTADPEFWRVRQR
ncbi:MAG: hypothetical protein ABSH32_09360 [Bryobacteraceae bacterium]|jgi:hypothetical protein